MIILASNSKTRADILRRHGVEFKQVTCNFDEEALTCKSPKEFVCKATAGKMQSFLQTHKLELPVLCADTVVTCNNQILRKAKDKKDAKNILLLQSGNEVSIITCMMYKSKDFQLNDLSSTTYKFAKFDEKKLEAYLNSNIWQGKAGACMVEGFCKEYILSVRGFESTAMGLCVEKLLPFLRKSQI